MEFKHFEYKGITFPVRGCTFTYGGKTIHRLIGSEVMSGMFFTDNGYVDKDAEFLDEMIAYYLPHDELMTLSDNQILDYIFYHLDEGIYDDF